MGEIYFKYDIQENLNWNGTTFIYTFQSYNLENVTIQDPLEDTATYFLRTCYDIRTDRIVRTSVGSKGYDYAEEIMGSPEIIEIIAQIKFFDGRYTSFTDLQIKALSSWLQKNNPTNEKTFFRSNSSISPS